MKISVVVPVRNEIGNIETLIEEIHRALREKFAYEMLFVDDGSTDGTRQELIRIMDGYPELRVLYHEKSCGQSRALHTGISAARHDWIVTLDGDGQNDPADIPALIETYDQLRNDKLWMLAGYRYRRNDTGWRRFSSKFANSVRQAVLHDNSPDTGCGLKLFRRDKYMDLPYFDHMHRFLPALMQMAGGEVVSVKVNHRARGHGRSKYGTLDRLAAGIVDLIGVIWLRKRHCLTAIEEVSRGQ